MQKLKRNKDAAGAGGRVELPNLKSRAKTKMRWLGDERAETEAGPMTCVGIEGLKQKLSGWVTSLILHVALLLLLALATFSLPVLPDLTLLAARVEEQNFAISEELLDLDSKLKPESLEETIDLDVEIEPLAEVLVVSLEAESAPVLPLEAENIDFGAARRDLGVLSANESAAGSGLAGSGLAGRGAGRKKRRLLVRGGGSKGSEEAVGAGLAWLARHQHPDGSWNFDHSSYPCDGRCANPGSMRKARAGATGLALLAFLGAGHTPEDGRHQQAVFNGIDALRKLMKLDKNGGSFWEPEGTMYSHGIAAMAICEAYAMTADPALRAPAQAAINFICYAQDPQGGGWRYGPRERGDTSVMGWQIGALKSGYFSKLTIPSLVLHRAGEFLDTVMVDQGAKYGYHILNEGDLHTGGVAVTPIGLLCRMYLGASRDDAGIKAGVEAVSQRGPSQEEVYFNFYAAQVLYHYTDGRGPLWHKWNETMRNTLVDTQLKEGHAMGSWTPAENGRGAKEGGRLYTTAMCTLTLEVYYRMLPIYRTEVVAEGFEFD